MFANYPFNSIDFDLKLEADFNDDGNIDPLNETGYGGFNVMPNMEGLGAYLNNPVMFGPQFRVVDVSGIFEETTSIQTISIRAK